MSIEGPSKADIECHDNEDGSCRVTYKPTEPGNYIINVKFADEHVPGKLKGTVHTQIIWFKCVTLIKVTQNPNKIIMISTWYHRFKKLIQITGG